MTKINKFDDLIKELNGIENLKIISEILDNIKFDKSKEKAIITCINDCTSPVNIKKGEEDDDVKTIFNAFSLFPLNKTKVLILGQDPYPKKGKAHGYAFSVLQEYTDKHNIDASLKNIYEAVAKCLGKEKEYKKCDKYKTDLSDWAKTNNVLLLNTALTYECKEKAKTHLNVWKPFINEVLKRLINNAQDLVVFLWGVPAQQIFYSSVKSIEEYTNRFLEILGEDNKENLKNGKLVNLEKSIKIGNNKIFMTSHPCNRSKWRGFNKNAPNHFKACDDFLSENDDNRVWENLWEYIKSPTKP